MNEKELAFFEDIGVPDAAIYIAVKGDTVHIGYSKNLHNEQEEMLDILETAAMMIAQSSEKQTNDPVH
jgi:hypothetical protein